MAKKKIDWEDREYDYEFAPATFASPVRIVGNPMVFVGEEGFKTVVFRVAMNSRSYVSQEKAIKNQSSFFDVRARGFLAERFLEMNLGKGSEVILVGSMAADNYENKNGDTIYQMKINADHIGISITDHTLQDLDYESPEYEEAEEPGSSKSRRKKARKRRRNEDPEDDVIDDIEEDEEDDAPKRRRRKRSEGSRKRRRSENVESDDDDEEDFEPRGRRRRSRKVSADDDVDDYLEDDDDVI